MWSLFPQNNHKQLFWVGSGKMLLEAPSGKTERRNRFEKTGLAMPGSAGDTDLNSGQKCTEVMGVEFEKEPELSIIFTQYKLLLLAAHAFWCLNRLRRCGIIDFMWSCAGVAKMMVPICFGLQRISFCILAMLAGTEGKLQSTISGGHHVAYPWSRRFHANNCILKCIIIG